MSFPAVLVGSVLGAGIQMYSNAVRKLPLMRRPWEHLMWAGIGGTFGYAVRAYEERESKHLEALLARYNATRDQKQ
jgi:hypothetical protein